MQQLHLALIHSVIALGRAAENREALQEQVRQAARAGARLVLAPELAVPGYSWESREAMAACAEEADGPSFRALAPLCREHRLFCGFGIAERDPASGLLFNTALVIGPDGEAALRYRKINAECRWAVPGDPRADNTFATPWGRTGLLICSDSYHALMPRMTALRGADLLLVPANWPPTGPDSLDPPSIWRARALENGMAVAVCNCGGMNGTMDCSQAVSTLIDAQGRVLARTSGKETHRLDVLLPLDEQGRLPGDIRPNRLSGRRPEQALACAAHLNGIRNWAAFHKLPEAGALSLRILPAAAPSPLWEVHDGDLLCRLPCPEEIAAAPAAPVPPFDCGPARIAVLDAALLPHPEHALAQAKSGCDLVVFFLPALDEAGALLARFRTIEGTAVLVSAPEGAALWLPSQGHEMPPVTRRGADGGLLTLDTRLTREKRFQDMIDYPALLRR